MRVSPQPYENDFIAIDDLCSGDGGSPERTLRGGIDL